MISMIAAMGENRVIGKDGDMPWHIPNDLKYFKQVTSNHAVIMGRKTYDSIGKALPNRKNYIVTRDQEFEAPDGEVFHSVKDAESLMSSDEEVFVIGGATIYEQFLPIADRLYITLIHEEFEGDTFFPVIDEQVWKVVSSEKGKLDEKNSHPHTFVVYERR
ncbi:dihydrofolate reductase [Evansella sp. AB-rgal1]|uniref:dihydrofolate reductase n=1 Tax=Evansella sp. AB-rgal1 TaxID=3242696 RepID=UPI00359D2FF7